MIYGNDYWWNFVIELEEKRQQIEAQQAQRQTVDEETYEEYVMIIALLGPLYKYLTEGRI